MNNDSYRPKEIDEALKIAAALDEAEEYHIPMKELVGMTLETLLNTYTDTQVNSLKDEIQVEIAAEEGTIFCNLKNNICVEAYMFPHDDE